MASLNSQSEQPANSQPCHTLDCEDKPVLFCSEGLGTRLTVRMSLLTFHLELGTLS